MVPLGDDQGRLGFTGATLVLIVGIVATGLYQWSLEAEALVAFAGARGLMVEQVQAGLRGAAGHNFVLDGLLPLFTHGFVHVGPIHALSTLAGLWVFGARLEARTSWWRFLAYFVACTVIGAAAQLYFGSQQRLAHVGATVPVGSAMVTYWLLYAKARVRVLVLPMPMVATVPVAAAAAVFAALQFHKVQEFLGRGCGVSLDYLPELTGIAAGGLLVGPLWLGPRRRGATSGARPA